MISRTATHHDAAPHDGARRSVVPARLCARPAEALAQDLLGALVVSTIDDVETVGRIVETEAYTGPDDPASHAARRIGRTARNATMFGCAGNAYVYLIYGMHWCLNVVASEAGDPQAVLIRALEPVRGLDTMRERRGRAHDLCSGPGRLCQALGIDGRLDGHDLSAAPLRLHLPPSAREGTVRCSGRIGIREARDWPLRFFLNGSPHVSRGPHLRLDRGGA